MARVTLIVADSLGVGEMPDAAAWGDAGADTLGHIAATRLRDQGPLVLPHLARLGLASIRPIPGVPAPAIVEGAYGKMATAGDGKDTITGHWELAGCRVGERFQTYYDGFPAALMEAFTARTGAGWIGNVAASGTEIIERLGAEHVATGKVIVYTSADSVFQVAAHESVLSVADLWRLCKQAFDVVRAWGIARVIARPFVDAPPSQGAGAYLRTENRRDFALQPPRDTVMDRLLAKGIPTTSIGKIQSIYGDRGFKTAVKAGNNATITQAILDTLDTQPDGLIFANLVDFDMLYGHRRDPVGYARALEALDARIPELLARLGPEDLLLITADHGNDPTFPGSDHTREYVPVLAWARGVGAVDLGLRTTLADCGATAGAWLGVECPEGRSFAEALRPTASPRAPEPLRPTESP
ncbi:MAG: phosphopentomutase [Pseudomonadota bacterium]|nr:phosphopentomutase [Pseudomonadota bacterium]